VRRVGANKVRSIRATHHTGSETEESIQVSTTNTQYMQARSYNELTDLNDSTATEPSITMVDLSNEDLLKLYNTPLVLKQPCHNQRVERHIKLVTEAAGSVAGFEKRDGMKRQRIRSRQIMKKFHIKLQFTV